MASSGHPLAARAPSGDVAAGSSSAPGGGSSAPDPSKPPKPQRQKRVLIESACSACRKRKSKCDGVRPRCSRCQAVNSECIYEAHEGESRWSALKRRSRALEAERDDAKELILQMQTRPEREAQEILTRVRSSSYQDLHALMRHHRTTSGSIAPSSPPTPSSSTTTQQTPEPSDPQRYGSSSRPSYQSPSHHHPAQHPGPVEPPVSTQPPQQATFPNIQTLLNPPYQTSTQRPDYRVGSVSSDGGSSGSHSSSDYSSYGTSVSQPG